MKKEFYKAPRMTVVEFKVEDGFTSIQSTDKVITQDAIDYTTQERYNEAGSTTGWGTFGTNNN